MRTSNKTTTIAFEVAGEPVSKARARFTRYGSKTRSYTPERTLVGEQRMKAAYLAVSRRKETDPELTYRVEAEFQCGTRQRRDVDNMMKLVLDGLNGVAWVDDNQVTEIVAKKSWVPPEEALTTVRITEIGNMDFPKRACLQCGERFRLYASQAAGNEKRFCSRACSKEYRDDRKRRVCEHCGTEFLRWGESRETRYCSLQCGYQARRKDVVCTHCGQTFSKQKCHVRATNYCSGSCQQTAARQRKSRPRGVCTVCGAYVTRAEYQRCNACRLAGNKPAGRPQESITIRPVQEDQA